MFVYVSVGGECSKSLMASCDSLTVNVKKDLSAEILASRIQTTACHQEVVCTGAKIDSERQGNRTLILTKPKWNAVVRGWELRILHFADEHLMALLSSVHHLALKLWRAQTLDPSCPKLALQCGMLAESRDHSPAACWNEKPDHLSGRQRVLCQLMPALSLQQALMWQSLSEAFIL